MITPEYMSFLSICITYTRLLRKTVVIQFVHGIEQDPIGYALLASLWLHVGGIPQYKK